MTGIGRLMSVVAAPTVLGWLSVLAQVGAPDVSGGGSSIVISGVAASAASAALAYMARQLASGNLVHKSSAAAEKKLEELAIRVEGALADSAKREDVYVQMLVGRAVMPPDSASG